MKDRSLAQVRDFFDACVPRHRKHLFTEYAQKMCPEQWKEFEELKVVLASPPRCPQTWTYTCNRYVVVSKELIRRVSFKLCHAVLP